MIAEKAQKENGVRVELAHISPMRKDELLMELDRILESDGWPGGILELAVRVNDALYRRRLRDMSSDLPRLRAAMRGRR